MKTTLELPDALVREIEKKAVLEERTFIDVLTALLRAGIASEASHPPPWSPPGKRTRAAEVRQRPMVTPKCELTPERIAEILHAQDALWHILKGRS